MDGVDENSAAAFLVRPTGPRDLQLHRASLLLLGMILSWYSEGLNE